ncbi:hypothetical protein WJX84_010179 [Apatococcus fuscideae]|uniref:PH domain-containing protein n=1 Tax=Apatococcus fuscideae TaxID=2026836 RepID=A0AAW1TBS1_9CHLO
MAAKGLTAHYFFTWGVVQESVHDDAGSQMQSISRHNSGWRTRLGLAKAEGQSGPVDRILHMDVANKAVNTIIKEAVKDTYQVNDVINSACLEGQDLRLFVTLRDGRRLTYFFQSAQDITMFREVLEELQSGEYAGVRYPRNVIKRGMLQKRGKMSVFFDRFAVLVPDKMYVLSSKAAVYPLNVLSLAESRPAMDETIKAIWVKVSKKEYLLRGLSEDDTRDWFDVMRPIPQVVLGAADSADLGLTRVRNRGQFMEALDESGQELSLRDQYSLNSGPRVLDSGFGQVGIKGSELRTMLSKNPSMGVPSGAFSPRIAAARSDAAGQQQAGMRGNQLASHVSFSPNSFGNRKPKRSSLVQPSSPHADDMLHPQDNSFDAIFSRITGQLTPAPTLDPAFDPNAPSHGDEGNTTSPGIFDKWRSALVDSLDHDSGSQSRHEATEQQWPQMNNTDMPGIIAQHMGNEHQLHEFQDNMQSGIAPLHSGGIQGRAGPQLKGYAAKPGANPSSHFWAEPPWVCRIHLQKPAQQDGIADPAGNPRHD